MSQPRYNPRTQRDEWYYRIKESFRDLTGRVRCRVMLNVGFIDELHHPEDIRDIGKCLTYMHKHECTNRQLKTDLNLRPIHHKKDDRSDAHLFLGLLSYWIVNTIRYKLKQTGEACFWTEIVRRLSTQKAVTTEATNVLGGKVHMRLCCEPNKAADDIYERLKYKKIPFRKIKIE